jgi:hypothetical protein
MYAALAALREEDADLAEHFLSQALAVLRSR